MASARHTLGERPDLMKGGGMRCPDGDSRPRRGHGKVSPHAFLPSSVVRAASLGSTARLGGTAAVGAAAPGWASAGQPLVRASATVRSEAGSSCRLGNGVKHVIQLTFDNVHFFRDNPNVPSDLQMMPSLLHFLEDNGTFASNNHTPLIAHTANDLLTTFTG